MGFFIGLLTFVLVLDCLALILLVLMQLPKKDAGAGLAFGGGATDALFGAGSGNVLTKATKYSATIFFVLALVIGLLQSNYHGQSVTNLIKATSSAPASGPGMTPPVTPPTMPEPLAAPASSSNLTLESSVPSTPSAASTTNLPPPE